MGRQVGLGQTRLTYPKRCANPTLSDAGFLAGCVPYNLLRSNTMYNAMQQVQFKASQQERRG